MVNIVKLGRAVLLGGLFVCSSAAVHAQGAGGGTGGGIGAGTGIGAGSGIGAGTGIGATSGAGGAGARGAGAGMTGTSFSGAQGGAGGAARTGTGATGIPAASNLYSKAFGNPYATAFTTGVVGTSMTTTAKPFGQATYTISNVANVAAGAANASAKSGSNFSTIGTRRAPSFITVMSPDMPRVTHKPAEMRAELVRSLEASTFLKDKKVDVTVEGVVVTLKGEVGSERERAIVEGMVRMTPGVRDVRNELVVQLPTSPPSDE